MSSLRDGVRSVAVEEVSGLHVDGLGVSGGAGEEGGVFHSRYLAQKTGTFEKFNIGWRRDRWGSRW